jgi:hypothetical protein
MGLYAEVVEVVQFWCSSVTRFMWIVHIVQELIYCKTRRTLQVVHLFETFSIWYLVKYKGTVVLTALQ